MKTRATLVMLLLFTSCASVCGSATDPDGTPFEFDENSEPGEDMNAGENPEGDEADRLDLLFVVDNSGSMCQEQRALRENFETFAYVLQHWPAELSVHLGVTTTDMNPNWELEPVAQPGHLQSTPQPVPGPDPACHVAVDERGAVIPGDYSPIRDSIAAAVGCMRQPDESFLAVTNAEIECAMYGTPAGCVVERAGCGGTDAACTPEDLFPDPSSYRELPRVLRSDDYQEQGELDVERMSVDFACMSLVGTRGYGVEKGIAAAIAATSPELTRDGGPNQGFVRPDSRFGLVFITDENDCTHDGSIDESDPCVGQICDAASTAARDGEGPLIGVEDLHEQLMTNLSATKGGLHFEPSDVVVASIHGQYRDLPGDATIDACAATSDPTPAETTCATSLGVAYSGSRYDRFLRTFAQFYPPHPADPQAPLTGWMCQGDFRPILDPTHPSSFSANTSVE